MSSTYSQSGRNTPVEQRIYTLSSVNSEETINTTAVIPTLNPAIPRIRILLAPYMSPYVVPAHKVKTWENLHRTLAGLFGTDVFNGRPVRITDIRGNTILPGVWKDLVEPNMTIIVDTCAYIPESSEVMFGSPEAENTPVSWDSPHMERPVSQRHEYDDHHDDSGNIESATAFILEEHDDENASYDEAHIVSPLGQVGDLASTAPVPKSWKTRPPPPPQHRHEQHGRSTSIFDKRATSISMFVGRRAVGDKIDHNITVKPLVIEKKSSKAELRSTRAEEARRQENINVAANRRENELRGQCVDRRAEVSHGEMGRYREEDDRVEYRYGKTEKKVKKSGWSRVARALMFILTAGHAHHHHQDVNAKRNHEEFRTNEYGQHGRWHTVSPRASQAPPMRRAASARPLQNRKGITPPAPLTSGRVDAKYHRRSRSLGAFPAMNSPVRPPDRTHSTRRQPNKLQRSTSERKVPGYQKPLSRSASLNQHHQCVISPPIPRRPSGDLGLNAQYVLADDLDIDELREMVQDQLDGSTLGGRSRRGTGSTGRTAVDSTIEPPQRVIPKLSAFPPRSPPRSPVKRPEMHPLPEADRRPPTATPLIARKPGMSHTIRRIASVDAH
ncbi:hypothetical protein BZA05DRAFT_18018 [Tricharina praecox]|uniref:uncharacterized protein n=1 Tax=Tricharina praecox TaxID=43433 RepID=UPI00221E60EA|nr:uncharacterized protein BZA05DRAFT_18018 [Tricharina praecox]KAI5858950.1 hypothetical protein BZA05DRAFT_18018 [Tricharina praecox]